jgi:cell division septal protein FtsQ
MGVREALYADSNLSIQKIIVEPNDALSREQLVRLESKLLGKNILQADIQGLSEELEKSPAILNAKIIKQFPADIYVEIRKRVPVAFIRYRPGGVFGVISEDGMILSTVTEREVSGLIIEASGFGADPAIGQFVKQRGFFESMKFLKAYQKQPVARYEPITKMIIDPVGNVNAVLKQGPEIRLGRRPQERLAAVEKILPLLESDNRKKIDYIDLQFDNVVVKQKRGV